MTVTQNIDWRFAEIMQGIQMLTAYINSKMDEKSGNLEHTLGQLIADVSRLKQYVGRDREDIQPLQEDNDNIRQRLERLEQELSSIDMISRRCNLKFLGVREPTRDKYRANTDVVVDVLNECCSSRTWHHSDIERAHRIGAHRQRSDQPRPLIVEFHRWSDRMEILTDGALRDLLRREGIRVTSDLSTRQRSEIQFYHQQGKLAYFKNGKLRVETDRRPHPPHRSQQGHRSNHDGHDYRDDENWPLPSRPDREPMAEVWNQRTQRVRKDHTNQMRRVEDDFGHMYSDQQRDRNASQRNRPPKQPGQQDHDRSHQQQDGWIGRWNSQEMENLSRQRQALHPEPHHDHRPDRSHERDYVIPWRTTWDGYEWNCEGWNGLFDKPRNEVYDGAESFHTHGNRSATVSRRARDVHSREPEDRHSSEGNQSKASRDAHHTTDPHNTVPGSKPYSEVIQSRTVPAITSEGGDKVRRNTAGNRAREGNDGKPDIVSVNENNELSSPPASYASETQNHIDNTGDPPSDGEAGPGSTLSVHAAHSPVPSSITGAQDVDEEDSEVSMPKNDVADLSISELALPWTFLANF